MRNEPPSIPPTPPVDSRTIRRMFDNLSPRYDHFNRFSSMGLDVLWRRRTLRPVRPGMRVLDIGTGTGDLAIAAAQRMNGKGEVVALDFSEPMLRIAEAKRQAAGSPGLIRWQLRSAEEIPFEEALYDLAVSGFVLRNLYENIRSIMAGVYKSLKPGGTISFVDLTEPENPVIRRGGEIYLNTVVSVWGRIFFGNTEPVEYLRDSMKRFFRAKQFVAFLTDAGFVDVRQHSFLMGMVTHYVALKPG